VILGAILEALGLGAAREARQLVERLPEPALAVATLDEAIARALEKAGHRTSVGGADAALSLALPDGEAGYERLRRIVHQTRPGGLVIVAGGADRARDAGLLLRVGLTALRQVVDGGAVFSCGVVAEGALFASAPPASPVP